MAKGTETIHAGNCVVTACPWEELFASAVQQQLGLSVVRRTHQPGFC